MKYIIIIFLLLLLLVGCATKENSKVAEMKVFILPEQNTSLDITFTSPECQNLVNKWSVIEGTIVDKKWIAHGYCGSHGDCSREAYLGIKTPENCIFYFSTLEITKDLGDSIRVRGLITAYRREWPIQEEEIAFYKIHIVQEVGPEFTMEPKERECTKTPQCPSGTEIVITQTYTGGTLDGCPFKWECE